MSAGPKLVIVDECLAPEKFAYLIYKGPDAWGVANAISSSLKSFFHVSTSGVANTRLNWDVSGNPITFYSTWWVKKDASAYSRFWWYFNVIGHKDKSTGEGEFKLRIHGEVKTEFSGWGLFLKPVWYLYSYLIYDRLRQKYIHRCRSTIEQFRNIVKEKFNLGTTKVQSTGGSYG